MTKDQAIAERSVGRTARPSHLRRSCAALLFVGLAAGLASAQQGPRPGRPDADPAARPATGRAAAADYEVHEWAVFVHDATRPEVNAVPLFASALPDFVRGPRPYAPPAAAATRPSPVGVLRVVGPRPADGGKVDVLLEARPGKFLAHWPPARARTGRLLWDGLELPDAPGDVEAVPSDHWYVRLRAGSSADLARASRGERFLLYDAELAHPNPLRLAAGGAPDVAYLAANAGPAAVHDVQVYKPAAGGWRVGGVARLDGAKPPAAATGPATVPATGPGTAPATSPAGVPVPLAGPPVGTASDAVAPWADRLAAAGLPKTDVPVILAILEHHAVDPRRPTVVYRLDPAEMDRLLPLEVTPAARRTVRVGLVVLRNAGPELVDEVDRLVAQLGDETWARREEAFDQLARIGTAAQSRLQAALTHKDLEVVWRAERLLRRIAPAK